MHQDNYILCIANILAVILLIFGLPHRQPGANLNLPLRILPLGDATTWGWQPNQENGTDGYRARLLRELVRARYHSVDFVGTQHSGFMDNNDNEGHEGHTISQLQGVMRDGLQMRPNLVLLHVGTNDLARPESMAERWSDAPNRLASLYRQRRCRPGQISRPSTMQCLWW